MIFDRVLCAVDASEAGLEAVRQAARLVAGTGSLVLVGVVDLGVAAQAGWSATAVAEELEGEERESLERARAEIADLGSAEVRLLHGPPIAVVRQEVERERATLLALGAHGRSRAAGIALDSVLTALLHEAPCAVLVARPPREPEPFPSSIVVGVDGSSQSQTAAAVAFSLRERFGARVRAVLASGGKGVDLDAARRQADVEVDARRPVDALVAASVAADLLVVGSRGLHGLRSLGSVSERVAHQARCSVLVVR